jgi:hypothetical protein
MIPTTYKVAIFNRNHCFYMVLDTEKENIRKLELPVQGFPKLWLGK